jgi:hypothetical protein
LANIYLHYVLDLWVAWWRKQRKVSGEIVIVRYADDFIVGFQYHRDSVRFLSELKNRLQQFDLHLNDTKTRLIEFGRYAIWRRAKRGEDKPETFDFLGFTHICGKFHKGHFHVIRQTSAKRLRRKLKELNRQLRWRRHWKIRDSGKWLRAVLIGHYRYYGVPYNHAKLKAFYHELVLLWYRQLIRRSQRTKMNWDRMKRICNNGLVRPKFYHPFPSKRLVV